MLTKTTISGLKALVFLGLHPDHQPVSPRVIAQAFGESPTYLAKVLRQLVKAGILKAQRGVAGGVSLNRSPEQISLLSIVEACQGVLLGDFCQETEDLTLTCAFHQAAAELHRVIVDVLSRWTLADMLKRPSPDPSLPEREKCWLYPGFEIVELVPPEKKERPVTPSRPRPGRTMKAGKTRGQEV
ncbi:RrF2 family transcriptional regulator [Thermogutta sp.]|uniref:RrF2 family transcriptional regulator n=1 Tax=Thermogutta sp. TaxID=1962930 RepID=UPI003C7C61B9